MYDSFAVTVYNYFEVPTHKAQFDVIRYDKFDFA